MIDDFEINEGHFRLGYNYFAHAANVRTRRHHHHRPRSTEHQGGGNGSQLLNLVASGAGRLARFATIRESAPTSAGEPAGNVKLDATGYVGFWLKTDDAGLTVRIGIDDPVAATPLSSAAIAQSIIADNQWHLYQWNLDNDNHWDAYSGGADGAIDAPNGYVTIDSIWFNGIGTPRSIWTMFRTTRSALAAAAIPGDYNGDGIVNMADYRCGDRSARP